MHEIDLEFGGLDCLNRVESYTLAITFLDPLITTLIQVSGYGLVGNVFALIFALARIAESYFKSIFTNEESANLYMQLLCTYTVMVGEMAYSEALNGREDLLIALILTLPMGWRLGIKIF